MAATIYIDNAQAAVATCIGAHSFNYATVKGFNPFNLFLFLLLRCAAIPVEALSVDIDKLLGICFKRDLSRPSPVARRLPPGDTLTRVLTFCLIFN